MSASKRIDPIGAIASLLALLLVVLGIASLAEERRPRVITCDPPRCYIFQIPQPAPRQLPRQPKGTDA